MRQPRRLVTPTRGDGIARLASEVIGGPVGPRAAVGRRGWLAVASVLSALGSFLIALGVLQKGHCVREGFATPGSLWRACYSDLAVSGAAPRTTSPWSEGGPGEGEPVLTAVLTWLLRLGTPDGSGLTLQRWFFGLSAVLMVLLVALTVAAVAWSSPTPWVAAHVALSPLLVTVALVSLDLFGVMLMAWGLACWLRGHPLAAGLLLGAATMARTFPALALVAVVLVAVRDGRRAELPRLLAGFAGAVAACLALVAAAGADPFSPYVAWWETGAQYGSPWKVVEILGNELGATTVSWLAIIGWGLAIATGAYLGLDRARQVPLPAVVLAMAVVVMITGKSFPPQESLWLLPLVAWCGLRWREHLAWVAVEVLYFVLVWLHIAGPSNAEKAMPVAVYATVLVLRLVALVGLAWTAVDARRDQDAEAAREREHDQVAAAV